MINDHEFQFMQTLTPQTNKTYKHACVESHSALKWTNEQASNKYELHYFVYNENLNSQNKLLYAPFLIAAEFTIKSNIRQIKMINIELKWKKEQRSNYM